MPPHPAAPLILLYNKHTQSHVSVCVSCFYFLVYPLSYDSWTGHVFSWPCGHMNEGRIKNPRHLLISSDCQLPIN
ncbi:hypothetical protein SRHO_G00225620 [Serrasalmus rhombeus]